MKFTTAFEALGYKVSNPRQHWSAENATGICITLWRKEMGFANGRPWVDTTVHAEDNAGWRDKPGNRKRLEHLRRALMEFDGFVDVVIVHGVPGRGYEDADPWRPALRGGRWRVTAVDEDNGQFAASVVLCTPADLTAADHGVGGTGGLTQGS